MENTEEKKFYTRRAMLAFFLSIITPGLGQLYNGHPRKALLFFFGLIMLVICFHVLGLNLYFWIYVSTIIIEIALLLFIAHFTYTPYI